MVRASEDVLQLPADLDCSYIGLLLRRSQAENPRICSSSHPPWPPNDPPKCLPQGRCVRGPNVRTLVEISRGKLYDRPPIPDAELARSASEWRQRPLQGDSSAGVVAHELEAELRRRAGAFDTLDMRSLGDVQKRRLP